jgi:hypothetical protein
LGLSPLRYTVAVQEERRFRVGAFFEWVAAGFLVALLVWVISVPAQRALGPGVEASLVEVPSRNPPGVPASAVHVPIMLLRDGREIRVGDLHTRLETLLPARLADGPAIPSNAEFGERHTRAYVVDRRKFYIVCERPQPAAPMRVAGIYLP